VGAGAEAEGVAGAETLAEAGSGGNTRGKAGDDFIIFPDFLLFIDLLSLRNRLE